MQPLNAGILFSTLAELFRSLLASEVLEKAHNPRIGKMPSASMDELKEAENSFRSEFRPPRATSRPTGWSRSRTRGSNRRDSGGGDECPFNPNSTCT